MTFFQALILGIVQGATEFFPVSSSAHLRLFKRLLGISDGEHLLYFDLLCHLGTLIALVFYLRKEILTALKDVRQVALFALALVPLVPAYFLLKPLRVALSDPSYLGYCLLCTAALLFLASRASPPRPTPLPPRKWQNVLCIGMMQTLALIPGISRSGSTIATARWFGWSWKEGAQFSFLLAVPTILGGEFLETLKWLKSDAHPYEGISLAAYAAGFLASLAVGFFAVRAVFWIYEKGKVLPFAWYCAAAAVAAFVMFHG